MSVAPLLHAPRRVAVLLRGALQGGAEQAARHLRHGGGGGGGVREVLQADGGDVSLTEIDGPVVKLQLEGACGTCPSSTMTMKMGLERGLKEKIPEIQEVIQVMPEGPGLSEEEVEVILGGVRPFLQVAGGSIKLVRLEGIDGLQPTITLKMEGASATLNSVKLEIVQRLQRHFMMSGLRVEWDQ